MSFADSLNKQQSLQRTASLYTASESDVMPMSVYSEAEMLSAYNDESEYVVSEKYDWYSQYSDDNYSTVNSTKDISVDSTQINLTQEENSQFIPFKIPRFWDGIDLMSMSIKIRYVNKNNKEGIATPCNVKYNNDSIVFAWLVDGNVTYLAGEITFEIFATGVNEKGNNYTWRTKPNGKLNIFQSLVGNGVIKPDDDWITQFIREIDAKIAVAQSLTNESKAYAEETKRISSEVDDKISNVETTLTNNIMDSVNDALSNYYTSEEIDYKFANIDISDQLDDIRNQINNIDGLANFNVEYLLDSNTLVFTMAKPL